MSSVGDMEDFVKLIKEQMCSEQTRDKTGTKQEEGLCGIKLAPGQILVIAGFLGGVLEVNSVLVNKEQEVQIVLTGSLKRPTQLDRMISQVGKMPFETVFKSIMDQLG